MKKSRLVTTAVKREFAAYVFLLPWIIGMAVFFAYPFLSSLYLGFTNARLTGGDFIGFDNFIRMLPETGILSSRCRLPPVMRSWGFP